MTDYRDYALELCLDRGWDIEDMLRAALCYMSQDDVADMLACNGYPDITEGRHPNA
jgi:hypothetical protein